MLEVHKISFDYPKNFKLKDISFTASVGEHVSIIGESGSGKSTLLKLLGGEFDVLDGTIHWKNNLILGPSHNLVIDYPFIKSVAQEFDLMPYISVGENIGKYLSNFFPEEKQQRIDTLLEVVELVDYKNTKVQFLSGGQKQRVALARALALQPEILLLDEPFSHIDNFKKQSLRRNLFKYLKDNLITCIVATHDKNDVLPYSDKIIVLNQGQILTQGTPSEIHANPKLPLVASFFGEFSIIEPHGIVYSHQLKVVPSSDISAEIKQSYYQGHYYLIEAVFNNNSIFFESDSSLPIGQKICLSITRS